MIKPYPHFEPGITNRFTIDTMGTLRLESIADCSLLIGGDRLGGKQALQASGRVWRPSQLRLEVNGQGGSQSEHPSLHALVLAAGVSRRP